MEFEHFVDWSSIEDCCSVVVDYSIEDCSVVILVGCFTGHCSVD